MRSIANAPPSHPSSPFRVQLRGTEPDPGGLVFRARDTQTGNTVVLKKLELEEEKHGFPITEWLVDTDVS